MNLSDDDLRKLTNQYGSPLYVYSGAKLLQNITYFKNIIHWPRFQLLFATMANPSQEILSIMFRENVGACVNSRFHLELCLSLGCQSDRIQFTSTGMTRSDMSFLIGNEIACNADSKEQADTWFELRGRRIGLRVNAATLNPSEIKPDRIGIDRDDVPEVVRSLEIGGGTVNGLHVYLGTNILHCGVMLRTLESFFALAQQIPSLEYLNIGGGVGIDYAHVGDPFPLDLFGRGLDQMMERLDKGTSLYFEPGRSLVANTGLFVVSVTDVKRLSGKRYVCVDGSIAQFPRPLHHPETPHSVRLLSTQNGRGLHEVTLVGRTTFSRDILAPTAQLPIGISVGDLIVFEDAGAYCSSMASKFLGQPDAVGVLTWP